MNRYRKYRDALRALRIEVPLDVPVRVRLNHGKHTGSFGWCGPMKGGGFTITVCTWFGNRRCTSEELRDTIVHEWAHARADTRCTVAVNDHGPEFGVAYAASYTAAIED